MERQQTRGLRRRSRSALLYATDMMERDPKTILSVTGLNEDNFFPLKTRLYEHRSLYLFKWKNQKNFKSKQMCQMWRVYFQFQRIPIKIHWSFHKRLGCRLIMPYYAVAKGRNAGIYQTWADCEAQVKGFSGARYKKFDTPQSAQDFISANGGSAAPNPKSNYYNYKVQYHAGPSSNNNNLKINYSTTSNNKNVSSQKTKKSSKSKYDSSEIDQFSDDSDDLNDIINKQMDDIEKRVNSFGKGIDKIIKKSTGKAIMIEPPAPKKRRSNNNDFDEDNDGFVKVYTDGACSQNGQKGARAGLGVYWGDGHFLNKSEPVSGRATNNCGEIQAATCAIRQALDNGVKKLAINTDSQFLINSVTKWLPGWKRKGWKLASGEPVKNEKDFKELDDLQHKLQIKWNYVEAHKGIHGNEMADQLARAGAAMYQN